MHFVNFVLLVILIFSIIGIWIEYEIFVCLKKNKELHDEFVVLLKSIDVKLRHYSGVCKHD